MASLEKGLDVRTVCNALGSLRWRWFDIGIQLGIPHSKLMEFKQAPEPLSSVVDYWLRENVTVPITWKSIVAILKSNYINEPGLADKINAEYCRDQSQKSHVAEVRTGSQEFKSAEPSRQLKKKLAEKDEKIHLLQQQIAGKECQIEQLQSDFDKKIQLLNKEASTTKSQFQQLQKERDHKIHLLHDEVAAKKAQIQQLNDILAVQQHKEDHSVTIGSDGDSHKYYDIVLVGKTGQGMSTLGNKLLNVSGTPEYKIRLFESEDVHSLPPTHPRKKKRFVQSSDPDINGLLSVTDRCKLLANDSSNIRVLDVPGFSDSGTLERVTGTKLSVCERNLQIIGWVVRAQIQFNLNVRHLVYFLPCRGVLVKADPVLQEEIKVLYHYFKKEVFNCMVVAATCANLKRYQRLGYDEDDFQETRSVFKVALQLAIPEECISCPPIVYIGYNDSSQECLRKIQGASVLGEGLSLQYTDDYCSRCSVKIRNSYKIGDRIAVVYPDGKISPYAESKCHPAFVPKHSVSQKIAGGFAHMLTLGIGKLVEKARDIPTWPGFSNAEEVCVECKQPPGTEGCTFVGRNVTYGDAITVKVDHSNEL